MKKLILLILTASALAQSGQFAPSGGATNLRLNVAGGVALVSTTATTIPGTTIGLTANATNYVYVDTSAGSISANTTGFSTNQFPVAIATTNGIQVMSLMDVRPGAFGVGSSGGGTPCVTTALSFQYNNAGAFGCVPDWTFDGTHTTTVGAAGIFDLTAMTVANLKFPSAFSTGLIKVTTGTGALSIGVAADIYGLFTSCTGSSGFFLKDGGTCAAAGGGSGTVNSGTATHLAYYATSTTAVSDAGADLVFDGTHTYSAAPTLLFDLSGAAGSAAFKVPSTTTNTASAAGAIDYDSTNSNYHANSGADSLLGVVPTASIPTTGHIIDASVVSSKFVLHDSGVVTANVVNASSPGAGIAHFAGSTQTVTSSAVVNADITSMAESKLTGSAAATTVTEAGAGDVVTRSGVETGNLTAPYVFQNTNSTNNNTSIGLIAGAAGTSTGGIGELVFDVSGTGDIMRWYSGGSVAAGVYTVGTLEGNLSATGALTVKSIPSAGAIGGTTPAAGTFTTGTFNTSITCTAATCLGSATATTQSAKDNSTKVATTAYVDRQTPLTTGTSVTLSAPRQYFICTSTCTITAPVPAAGDEFCVQNDVGVSTVITFAAIGSSSLYGKTDQSAYGTAGTGTLVSGGAAGDKMCLLGKDATHYNVASFNGVWTAS